MTDMEKQREDLAIDLADRYFQQNQTLPIAIPHDTYVAMMMLDEKPPAWWCGNPEFREWMLRIKDEIIEGRNAMASNGRDLHDEPSDKLLLAGD